MMSVMNIDGYQAVITYDPDIEMFRGEFVDLNGGADFYAKDRDNLKKEGALSLKIFLEMCAEDGVAPRKNASKRSIPGLSSQLHPVGQQCRPGKGCSLNTRIGNL